MIRLAHPNLRMILEFKRETPLVLTLENRAFFRECVIDLKNQEEGQTGRFVLSKDWTPIALPKVATVVTDPFRMELNSRRILSALYKEMIAVSLNAQHHLETLRIQSEIDAFLGELELEIPFPVVHNDSTNMNAILKAFNVRVDVENEGLPFQYAIFLKAAAELLRLKLVIFTGLHCCLTNEEIEVIHNLAEYEDLCILDIENRKPEEVLPRERLLIVDNDMCEIYNDE